MFVKLPKKKHHLSESMEHYHRHYSRHKKYVNLKTHYFTISLYDVVIFLRDKYRQRGDERVLDHRKVSELLKQQPFFKAIHDSQWFPSLVGYSCPKKRTDRWFKQNMNRFLSL